MKDLERSLRLGNALKPRIVLPILHCSSYPLLASAETGFVLVAIPDRAKLSEAQIFISELQRSGHHLAAVLLNRARPTWWDPDGMQIDELKRSQNPLLVRLGASWRDDQDAFSFKVEELVSKQSELQRSFPLYVLPQVSDSLVGLEGLTQFSERLLNLEEGI